MNPTAEPPTPMPGFSEGLAGSVRGLLYLNQHPALWRFAIWPTLLNAVISGLVLVVMVVGVITLIAWRVTHFDGGDWWAVMLEVLIALGLVVLALGVTLAVFWLAQGVLMGHFYSRLAAKVEEQLGIDPREIEEVSFRYQVIDAVIDTTLLLAALLGFLVLQLIPIIGTVIGLVGWVYANGYILGRDVMDHPLKLRGWRRARRRAFGWQHRGVVVGLGLVVFLLNFLPLVGAMLQTTTVVGAVLLHREMQRGAVADV